MTRIYHKENIWEVIYYIDNLKGRGFHALIYAKMQDFDLEDFIILEFKGKFYRGYFDILVRDSIGSKFMNNKQSKIDLFNDPKYSVVQVVELLIDNLIDETRDIKIKLITNEKI